MYGLTTKDWNLVCDAAIYPLINAGCQVWVFGSRARGDFKPFSDLDILYHCTKPLPADTIGSIKERLINSSLPILVDFVDLDFVESSYLENIKKDRIKLS